MNKEMEMTKLAVKALDEKKAIAMEFGKHPLWACQYCNGFDPEHSERFPAGEQL